MPYWSLSSFLKAKVKEAVKFITVYEETLAKEAKKQNCDGIISGHIHHAEIRDIQGIQYINCGDWVESCSAIVETIDGEFQLLNWVDITHDKYKPKNDDGGDI